MPLLLLQLGAHPAEIAATKLATCVEGGAYFLDFSRPLRRLRWFGTWNQKLGFTLSLLVPVVHQAESTGRRIIAVAHFSDRGRLFQADRGRRFSAIVDARGLRASEGFNVSQSSTISLKRGVDGPLSVRP